MSINLPAPFAHPTLSNLFISTELLCIQTQSSISYITFAKFQHTSLSFHFLIQSFKQRCEEFIYTLHTLDRKFDVTMSIIDMTRCGHSLTDLFKGYTRHPVSQITRRAAEEGREKKLKRERRNDSLLSPNRSSLHRHKSRSNMVPPRSLKIRPLTGSDVKILHWSEIHHFSLGSYAYN